MNYSNNYALKKLQPMFDFRVKSSQLNFSAYF